MAKLRPVRSPTLKYSQTGHYLLFLLLVAFPAGAQDTPTFDELAAADELQRIATRIAEPDIKSKYLRNVRLGIAQIEADASRCALDAADARLRLEARFEPLRDVDPEVVGAETMNQRQETGHLLDEATAREARCRAVADDADALAVRVAERQNALSQEFLSNRTKNVIALARDLPTNLSALPSRIREVTRVPLHETITWTQFFWALLVTVVFSGMAGFLLRRQFGAWYVAAGGDDAPPRLKYLVPKPVAEFAPVWLLGAALIALLSTTVVDASTDLFVVRIAWAIFLFGIGCVIINWSTGPLSPAADVQGLVPDHAEPVRKRLRFLLFTICLSFVVLGSEWLAIRVPEGYVVGRTAMVFLTGVAFLFLLHYLGRIPEMQRRFLLLRYLTVLVAVVGIVAAITGFQNFGGFLIRGVTLTGLALYLLWILLWLVFVAFDYLFRQDTPAAAQARAALGVTSEGVAPGLGVLRLITDLLLWIGFTLYMIYVWDNSGTTLEAMKALVTVGVQVGDARLVPIKIVTGILIFAGIIVVVGWMKRWIDRRWLQHIVLERGAREAIVTLIGYVGFVSAVLIALRLAGVDLGGLAWASAALALGIGFGMQEIAGNFVSGLILLFERPIRAGDFITVGDTEGYVRKISIRATEMETLDNQNVLVPNSELVSGRVTNWVLRDSLGRLVLKVGVAYGSDVEKVRDILESIAREHKEVITDGTAPAPRALFMSFGDSSLDFELRMRVRHIERRFSVKSDLNFLINKAFREAGISIPFPQRDLHIITQPDQKAATEPSPVEKPLKLKPVPRATTRSHTETLETACGAEEVWAAVTDINALKRWVVADGTFSAELGGGFDLELVDGATVVGHLDDFSRPHRLRAVVRTLGDESRPPTGPITFEFLLRPVDNKTLLTVTVRGIPDSEDWEQQYRLSVDRWQNALIELKTKVLRR